MNGTKDEMLMMNDYIFQVEKPDVGSSNTNMTISSVGAPSPGHGGQVSEDRPGPGGQVGEDRCAGCGQPLRDGQALVALDKQYHIWCFKCTACEVLLHGEYMGHEGRPYCEKCYHEKFGVRCTYCHRYGNSFNRESI